MGDTQGYSVEIPGKEERPLCTRSGGKTFWFFQLKAGLHFPIPYFFMKLSKLYGIPLNQVNHAYFRKAVFFHMILTLEGVEDTATLFYSCYKLKHMGFHLYFSPLVFLWAL